jgi:uncharacterized tellurite resistance protein B-like protein/GTPase Era involved in 16S rRNA processing
LSPCEKRIALSLASLVSEGNRIFSDLFSVESQHTGQQVTLLIDKAMDTSLISTEAVALLSHITGQKLSQRDITPPVIFMAALVTVLLGVMFVDGTITDEEKQRWQKTINRFIPPGGNVRQLTQLLSKGIRQNQVYKKLNELLTLAAPLSESERLLLIGFGYEMSAADGDMDAREKKYLEVIANRLGINSRHLAVLEAGFTNQEIVELAALDEVQSLLAPARFHELDTIFVKAASDMLAALPAKPEHQGTQQHRALSYEQLKEFQKYRKQLDSCCYQVFQILKDCNERDFLPSTVAEEIGKVSRKLQSQRFRLAVIGEFSKGKSTLLNALLGEKIQPVREIPCSGTVTVLKYGTQKRVVCRYKNGRVEEIPFENYQVNAVISEQAAMGSLSEELARSEIDEIIFEHPELDLCSSGVEIVDSPGLNEHPERTAITQKLVKDTDAAIFLINASQVLTQGERDLLQDLRTQLNVGKADVPAENLFIVVNFWDLLRTETGRNQVQQRVINIIQGQNLVITSENRIHFISAQAALDAILTGTENEYLKSFQGFTQSIEKFLTVERGSLEIKQAVAKINGLIQESLEGLAQAEKALDGKLNLSEAERQKILEQIGEASGRDVRIRNLADQLIDEAINQAVESWNNWNEGLGERMAEQSTRWYSQHSHIWSKDKLIRDYADQFSRDLQREIHEWGNTQLRDAILRPKLEIFERSIRQELEAIQQNFKLLDQQIDANLSKQLHFRIRAIDSDINGTGSLLGGIGAGGALAAGLYAFTLIAVGPIIVAALATAIVGSLGLGMLDADGIHYKIKSKVMELGFQKFDESMEKIWENLGKTIGSAFSSRVETADEAIQQVISCYENLLEQQEKADTETLEQRQAEKVWIAQKCQELQQVQKNIEAILPS